MINRSEQQTIALGGSAEDEHEARERCEEDLRHAEVEDLRKSAPMLYCDHDQKGC
jgi:hypothetical protein